LKIRPKIQKVNKGHTMSAKSNKKQRTDTAENTRKTEIGVATRTLAKMLRKPLLSLFM